jgi:hypothetical protein
MLRTTAAALVCIAWGLWFGGLGAIFLFVTRLFSVDRDLAIKTAPQLFLVFERYQIVLAAASLLGAVAWRVVLPSPRATTLFWMLAIAAVMAAVGPMLVTDRMLKLWANGQSASPQFHRLHGWSMLLYSAQGLVLLVTGLLLPWAMSQRPPVSSAAGGLY